MKMIGASNWLGFLFRRGSVDNSAESKSNLQVHNAMGVFKLIVLVIACALVTVCGSCRLAYSCRVGVDAGLGVWGPVFAIAFMVAPFFSFQVQCLRLEQVFSFEVSIDCNHGPEVRGLCAFSRVVHLREWVARKVSGNPKFNAIDEAVGREGFKIVFLLRLSPVFPFNLLNYSLGLTKVSFKHYALASMIGMLPGGLMYVYFGSAARSIADVAAGNVESGIAGQIFFWIGLVATILVAGFVTRLAKKSLKGVETAATTGEQFAAEADPAETDPLRILPEDEYNRELVSNVHPRIGPILNLSRDTTSWDRAGTADWSQRGAAGLGAKVALWSSSCSEATV
jgi:hypothetical protein